MIIPLLTTITIAILLQMIILLMITKITISSRSSRSSYAGVSNDSATRLERQEIEVHSNTHSKSLHICLADLGSLAQLSITHFLTMTRSAKLKFWRCRLGTLRHMQHTRGATPRHFQFDSSGWHWLALWHSRVDFLCQWSFSSEKNKVSHYF